MCHHTCICTSTPHRVRGLRVWPFPITPLCRQSHSVFGGIWVSQSLGNYIQCQGGGFQEQKLLSYRLNGRILQKIISNLYWAWRPLTQDLTWRIHTQGGCFFLITIKNKSWYKFWSTEQQNTSENIIQSVPSLASSDPGPNMANTHVSKPFILLKNKPCLFQAYWLELVRELDSAQCTAGDLPYID